MMTTRRPLVLVVTFGAACVVSGCDLFGVRCDTDGDCPDSLPACVEGACVDHHANDERTGPCESDADCGRGLCYDLDDDSDLKGTCVPREDIFDDCPPALDEATQSRDDDGPALISLAIGPQIEGCVGGPSYSLTFRYFDRAGDMPAIDSFTAVLFVRTEAGDFASASALYGSEATGDDPTHAALVVYEACGQPPFDAIAAWLEDENGHRSNVVCTYP